MVTLVEIPLYSNDCFRVMNEMRRKSQLCDVILRVKHIEFPAHRIVLAGASRYLQAMFTNGMLESGKTKVDIGDIEPQTMANLLDFVYTGSIELTTNNVQQLCAGATMLHLTSLANSCANFLEAHMDYFNCIGIRAFADHYSCTSLENFAFRYICEHFLDVVQSEEFLQLSKDGLLELIQSNLIQVYSEDEIFNAVEVWIKHHYEARKGMASELLQHVRLPLVSLEFLETRVVPASFVKNDSKCQMLLATALNSHKSNLPSYMFVHRAQPQMLYTVGGRNSDCCQLATLEQYDVATNSWSSLEPMTCARTAVGTCSLNGYLYVIGGECANHANPAWDTTYKKIVEIYYPKENSWRRVAELTIPRSFASAVSCDGYVYALGGEDRLCSYNFVEKYDPEKDFWLPVQSMKRRRSGAGAAVCNGMLFVAGGYDRGIHTDRASVECYDPKLDQWIFVTELEKARSGLGLVSLDGCIYAVGGRNRSTDSYFDLVERYDTRTHHWSPVAPMNSPRAWAAVVVYKENIFAIGGFDGANRLNSVEMYDPVKDIWTNIEGLNVNRAGCGAAVL
ncbi:LOW QUALITY PROTEIN: kelch-like ECH-associated protein 1B [Xenia sp. Carnegie-2017]|uniref:LOW QUALITY PROTEIN: kelch-like ECH-associated protein 1B n=1 Tax=Xenia sp. Carnegie-2017 TaxID=2897299 RepID=UPI001F04A3E1|nr:LOW QUALITY PROTEIN: kelch-like ECH-associated protein 1B [Xenia sp. Carnegie-2017]